MFHIVFRGKEYTIGNPKRPIWVHYHWLSVLFSNVYNVVTIVTVLIFCAPLVVNHFQVKRINFDIFLDFCLVFDAFEHWKKLLNLLCSCDEAVETNVDLFDALIGEFNVGRQYECSGGHLSSLIPGLDSGFFPSHQK